MNSRDPYLHQNLTPDQITMIEQAMRNTVIDGIPLDPRDTVSNAKKFNSYPIELRKKLFSKLSELTPEKAQFVDMGTGKDVPVIQTAAYRGTTEEQPVMQNVSASGDSISNLIMGAGLPASGPSGAPRQPSAQAPTQPETPADPVSNLIMTAGSQEQPAKKARSFKDFLQAAKPEVGLAKDIAGQFIYQPAVEVAGRAKGLFESVTTPGVLTSGQAPKVAERSAAEFIKKYGYEPSTPEGQAIAQGLASVAEAAKVPPAVTPELAAVAPVTRGVGTQLMTRGRGGVAVPSAAEVPPPATTLGGEAARVEPTMGKPKVSYAEFQKQLQAQKEGGIVPPPLTPQPSPTMPRPTTIDPFPEVNYAAKGAVPLNEQEARKGVLSRIGLDSARESSIQGDGKAASNEYQTSRTSTAVGDLYKATLDKERATLEAFGQKIVERTGGSFGLDETALYDRGTRIAKPFDDFKTALQSEMNDAYKMATEKAAGQPAVMPQNIQRFLDTDSNFTVNDSFMALRRGIQSHLKENNLLDKDGRILPMTVKQAEDLRKYVNSNWNNERSGIIGRIKDKIDNDVTKVAGEDVYKKARDIRIKIGRLLDDPKGVSKIMDYDPQNPINRTVPFEKIATTIERMDVDQQTHLIKLLKQMPETLRPQADAAIAEIKAHLANRILQEGSKTQGQWNAKNVSKYLKDNNKKLAILTEDPEIAQMVRDLNAAGHILKYDASYPGAAIQAHNLTKLGVPLLGTIGGSLGTAIGSSFGVGGAALGGTVGAAAGAKKGAQMAEKSALKRGQKKMIPLKDIGKGQ